MTGSSFLRIISTCIVLFVLQTAVVLAEQTDPSPTLYQISSSSVFESGEYSEIISVDDLKNLGTIGIAGFEDLNGEVIELDGRVWQITTDGVVSEPPGDSGICFGNTIRFEPSIIYSLNKTLEYKELLPVVNDSFPDHNLIYAYRIEGDFSRMKVRSIPLQQEPYPPLPQVIANQTIFELSEVNGTIIGFWSPGWMEGVNFIGFHPHFVTSDHTAGGHVLDFTAENVTVSIQPVHRFTVILGEENE